MTWGAGLADPPLTGHRRGWGAGLDAPDPRAPEVGWTGSKAVTAAPMAAAVVLNAPTITAGMAIEVPSGRAPSGGFPYGLPFELSSSAAMTAGVALGVPVIGGMPVDVRVDEPMSAGAALDIPDVSVAAPVVAPPPMETGAVLVAPAVGAGVVVPVPRTMGLDGLPCTLPFELGHRGTAARMARPSVTVGHTVQPAPAGAAAALVVPSLSVGHTVVVPAPMGAESGLGVTGVQAGHTVYPPPMEVFAGMAAPTPSDGDTIVVPAPMTAGAGADPPIVAVLIPVEVVVPAPMGAGARGFPYPLPFEVRGPGAGPTRAALVAPSLSVGHTVAVPASMSAGAALGGTPALGATVAVPTPMGAEAGMLAPPALVSGVVAVPAQMTAAATFPAALVWFPDEWPVVTASGTSYVTIPPWARYVDVVVLGGAAGGAKGSLFASGDGGRPGQYGTLRWDRGDPRNDWTQLEVVLGSGGGSRNGAGGATTVYPRNGAGRIAGQSVVGPGGSGTNSGRDGQGPGNATFNGISATGGSGNGSEPGSGGKGGASGFSPGNGDAGAKGRAWIRFSM